MSKTEVKHYFPQEVVNKFPVSFIKVEGEDTEISACSNEDENDSLKNARNTYLEESIQSRVIYIELGNSCEKFTVEEVEQFANGLLSMTNYIKNGLKI